ncbi:hypothetical protein GCK72_021572 [Caenorhabditis remanei]|uniref:BPTI/Kunitz inhibitor domain-containing protein n=1 Tax=Caenorhabditis remanei TaxID=31234 RepID=A0A6A5GKD9_CAERE|nr:hypothetical protein GCK72_021572 [Caenorhabditis remanei]KAF1755005.1 hypothetical protein GCK72_021572 [Caenorhabditis remanei]
MGIDRFSMKTCTFFRVKEDVQTLFIVKISTAAPTPRPSLPSCLLLRISCKNTTTSQPLAKWYFDLQTLSCEMYPFGMCEDDPLDKLALRTRAECEERCDVAKVKEALGDTFFIDKLKENSLTTTENFEKEAPIGLPRGVNASQIAIDDVIQESKHIRGRPFAIEPPTDLLHVIHVKSDSHKFIEIDENQLLTTTVDETTVVPTVTSDVLEILEKVVNDDHGGEGSGHISVTISGETENSENSEESNTVVDSSESLESKNSEKSSKIQEEPLKIEKQQRKKSVKSMEDSFERFYQRNKESVSCSATAYRLLCSTGAPTQFVYRWEKVGGVCQSFPYGYCLHEKNVPHPRTRAECEQFCD